MSDTRFGEIHEVDERQLQLLMKDWRRGRATRTMWQAMSDAYVAIFSIAVIGAMIIGAIVQAQRAVAICSTEACLAGRGLLPWAALAGAFAFTLAASLMFGPVLASSAEGFWLMDAPLGRRRLLSKRLWLAIVASLLLGAGFGALVSALTGSSGWAVLGWALGTGLGASGLVAVAAVEQTAERRWVLRTLQWITGLAGVAALAVVVGTAAGWFSVPGLVALGAELSRIVAGVGVLLTVVAAAVAYRRLNRIRRQRLTSGGSLLSGMQGAMFALDFGLVRDILVERQASLKGHVKATRGVGHGLSALIWRDVQRLIRYPRPLLLLVASVIVPYAIAALGLAVVNPTISAFVLMVALIPFMNSLRVLTRTKGLQRCLPFKVGQIRTAAMVVPAILAVVWSAAVVPAFLGLGTGVAHLDLPTAITYAVITGLAGLLAAVRWVSAAPANYSAPMVATGAGAMPPGLMFNMFRGFDIVALVTLPLVLGWSPWVSIIIALIAFSMLRSGLNQEALMDQQAEQKRQLEEAKAAARGEGPKKDKIRVQRGR